MYADDMYVNVRLHVHSGIKSASAMSLSRNYQSVVPHRRKLAPWIRVNGITNNYQTCIVQDAEATQQVMQYAGRIAI